MNLKCTLKIKLIGPSDWLVVGIEKCFKGSFQISDLQVIKYYWAPSPSSLCVPTGEQWKPTSRGCLESVSTSTTEEERGAVRLPLRLSASYRRTVLTQLPLKGAIGGERGCGLCFGTQCWERTECQRGTQSVQRYTGFSVCLVDQVQEEGQPRREPGGWEGRNRAHYGNFRAT